MINGDCVAEPRGGRSIECKALALYDADDPLVPAKNVAVFEEEMRGAKVDWQLVKCGGAMHSFTDWTAGGDNSNGAAYNEKAGHHSCEATKEFFVRFSSKPVLPRPNGPGVTGLSQHPIARSRMPPCRFKPGC